MVRMITVNIFRCLPRPSRESTRNDSVKTEEDVDYLELHWTHLKLWYELFLRYVISPYTDAKVAKRYLIFETKRHNGVAQLLEILGRSSLSRRTKRSFGRNSTCGVPTLHVPSFQTD
ncbi:hypothetical protein RJ640_022722 [Escallonia rubra]|uniref:Uncharacterized protein n=1 Tax=Escallonia rubra TaxID=112253 RepID=A0AA88QIZ6_9ASTE|nr:hypothetical protein RJ640_022722 [Escallonia rubra]